MQIAEWLEWLSLCSTSCEISSLEFAWGTINPRISRFWIQSKIVIIYLHFKIVAYLRNVSNFASSFKAIFYLMVFQIWTILFWTKLQRYSTKSSSIRNRNLNPTFIVEKRDKSQIAFKFLFEPKMSAHSSKQIYLLQTIN